MNRQNVQENIYDCDTSRTVRRWHIWLIRWPCVTWRQ